MPNSREFHDKLRRHAEYFENKMRFANELYERGAENSLRGLEMFDLEWLNIEKGQAWAAQHIETDDIAAKLCNEYPDSGSNFLVLRQIPHERINWLESALIAAQRLNHRRAEGAHLGNLGVAHKNLGEFNRAVDFYAQSLLIAREIGDRGGESQALGNLGILHSLIGKTSEAIVYYEQSLALHKELGDQRGEGADLVHLGIAYKNLGDIRRAIDYYEQRLVIAREIRDEKGEGAALGNLGSAYLSLEKVDRAAEYYEQQLIIARKIGDLNGEGNALWGKALCFEKNNDTIQAISEASAALEIFIDIESPSAKKMQNLLNELHQSSTKEQG